jgi:hypothetical protein
MNPVSDAEFKLSESGVFARNALRTVPVAARAGVVNRTHRVVRERAKVMQEKRSRDRSLMLPLGLCCGLLMLIILGVWTGLYEYQAAENVQGDVAAWAAIESTNHFLVVMLWFVPVSIVLMVAVWVRRSRSADDEAF